MNWLNVLALTAPSLCGPLVPVIYNADFRDPAGYFLANQFQMRDKDVLFAANAATVDSAKFLQYVRVIVATANDTYVDCEQCPDIENKLANCKLAAVDDCDSGSNCLVLLYTVVALAPLPFGSVDELTIAFWVGLLGVAAVLAISFKFTRPQWIFLLLATIVALAWGLVLHEQTSVHPWFAKGLYRSIWPQASELLGVPAASSTLPLFAISLSLPPVPRWRDSCPCSAGFSWEQPRLCEGRFARVCLVRGDLRDLRDLQLHLGSNRAALAEKLAYRTVLTGTFINRNTAALYFGICAIVWLLLFFKDILDLRCGLRPTPIFRHCCSTTCRVARCLALSCSLC